MVELTKNHRKVFPSEWESFHASYRSMSYSCYLFHIRAGHFPWVTHHLLFSRLWWESLLCELRAGPALIVHAQGSEN